MKNYIFGDIQNTKIGQIFNNRKDLHDAGIHAPLQAGIWGKASEGACSIVLSGGYIDDIDNIDNIIYTGDSGRDANTGKQSSDQVLSPGNSGLIKSYHDKLPIRVTRGFQTSFGPKFGYRYDGLYFIDSFVYTKGSDGFMVYQFYLSSQNKLAELELAIDKTNSETFLTKANRPAALKKTSNNTPTNKEINAQKKSTNLNPIQVLRLSRRSENGLLNAGIKTLEDLAKVDDLHFSRLPNLGKKSINEIKASLLTFTDPNKLDSKISGVLRNFDKDLLEYSISYVGLSTRLTNRLMLNNFKTLKDLYKVSNHDLARVMFSAGIDSKRSISMFNTIEEFLSNTQLHKEMRNDLTKGPESITSIMDRLFATKYKKHKDWLIDRLFHGATLEGCGKTLGVTRERIRQVQNKFIKQIKFELSFVEKNLIEDYLKRNGFIRNVFELEQADPIFSRISKYLGSATKPNEFYRSFFTLEKIASWEKIEIEIRILPFHARSSEEIIASYNLNSESHFRLSLEDSIKGECLIAERSDAFEYIYKSIYKKFNSPPIMARYAMARLRYKNLGQPIKIDQVLNFIKEEFDYDPTQEKRAIAAVFYGRSAENERTFTHGLYPYGKYSFIFADDAVDKNIAKKIVMKVIETLLESPERQFNLKNILKKLLSQKDIKTLLDSEQIIMTHNLLQVFMRIYAYDLDNRVIDHGRLIWSITESEIASVKSEKRIEKYPLILKILKENGAPMHLKDIQKEVNKIRGSAHFQIHTTKTTPNIILIQRGLWGLRDRDINVTKEQEENLIAEIVKSFKSGKKIIDINDILKYKKSLNLDNSVRCFQIAKMLNGHIPVGRRRTPDKVIFLQKCSHNDLNRFAIYSIDISDDEIDEYIPNISLNNLPDEETQIANAGNTKFWSLQKACKFFIKTEIKNQSQYIKWRRYEAQNEKNYIPQNPDKVYKDKWLGWNRLEEML